MGASIGSFIFIRSVGIAIKESECESKLSSRTHRKSFWQLRSMNERPPLAWASKLQQSVLLVAVPLMLEARKAEEEGYDAIVIDCAADPAVRAVREYVRIPVTSAGEAAFQYVLGLGDRFSVVTVLENTARLIEDRLRGYCLMSRVASVRYADVPVLGLEDMSLACERILAQAREAIDKDGADAIVLGCTGMSPVTKYLQENLEVPVVDPAVAALTLAESLVRMGLSHSRKCYLNPPAKKIEGPMYNGWTY